MSETEATTGVDTPEETVDPEASGSQAGGDPAQTGEAEPLLAGSVLVDEPAPAEDLAEAELKAVIEAIVYITEEPVTALQIANGLGLETAAVQSALDAIHTDCAQPGRGLMIRQVAGGYKMSTKPEHHEAVRRFVKSLKPPLKLSLAALETLAVIAYKQPITAPEILDIRGVQGAGVLKTLLDRKLITIAGRKQVVGKPALYKTTKEFLIQFGLRDLSELPTLKEFEDLKRLALQDEAPTPEDTPAGETPVQPELDLRDGAASEAVEAPAEETQESDER
jgi:segregation and condensation protein B